MAERETATGSAPDPSAVGWADKFMQSDLAATAGVRPFPLSPAELATRSLGTGEASTGVTSTDLVVSPIRFGGYEILEKIGLGGMGAVYRARHLKLGRVEALKVIAPRSWDDSVARTRFEREFKALAKIEHPNIIPVYDAGAWEGLPYFTMKYVPGGALSKHLDRFRADPTAAARIMAKVARAVQHLHLSGVLHRDLKPHNILLGDRDEPLVADFGLVKDLGEDSEASLTGTPMGTRQYMSPEQTYGQKADYAPSCDIWAIGVILYELLAGARPFPSTDPVDVYIQIRAAIPVPVTDVNPAVPRPLAAIAHRCLAKLPADRYPTAAAVADDLEAWLAGGAITPTRTDSRRLADRRGWSVVSVSAAAIAALGIGLAEHRGRSPRNEGAGPDNETRTPAMLGEVGKQLAAGRTVELIGPLGPPKVIRQLPSDSGGLLAEDRDKPCRFASFYFGMLDLVNEDLPLPVRLDAEVALYTSRPGGSFAGVYVGRRHWPAVGHDSALLCALTLKPAPAKMRQEMAMLKYVWAAPGTRVPVRGNAALADFPARPHQDGQTHWRKLTVTLGPRSARVAWDGLTEHEVTETDMRHWVRKQSSAEPPADPPLGPGLGLTVGDGEGVFRNVRLTPLFRTNP